MLKIDHSVSDAIIVAIDLIAGALCLCNCCLLICNATWNIWLVVAWHNLGLPCCNQPLLLLLLAMQHKSMLVTAILVIDSIIYLIIAWDVLRHTLAISPNL
jgi:hypothetical protein